MTYSKQEIFDAVKNILNVNIKNSKAFNKLMTLDGFCIAVCDDLNSQINTTNTIQRPNLFCRIKQRFGLIKS